MNENIMSVNPKSENKLNANIYNCFAAFCANSTAQSQESIYDKLKYYNNLQTRLKHININQDQMALKEDIFNYLIMELVKERLQLGHQLNEIQTNLSSENSHRQESTHGVDSSKNKVFKNHEASTNADLNENIHSPIRNISVRKKSGKVIDFVQYPGADGKPIFKQKRAKRGQYRKYEQDQLNCAMNAVLNGSMSVHKAGSRFGVPHSTLEYKVKEKQGIQTGSDLSCSGLATSSTEDDRYIKGFNLFLTTD